MVRATFLKSEDGDVYIYTFQSYHKQRLYNKLAEGCYIVIQLSRIFQMNNILLCNYSWIQWFRMQFTNYSQKGTS